MVGATMLGGFMTVNDVCDYLSISRHRAYSLINSGELPVVKLGDRARLIPREAVKQLAEKWEAQAVTMSH